MTIKWKEIVVECLICLLIYAHCWAIFKKNKQIWKNNLCVFFCRVISESVSCIESLLNQAYERNAVLESEVDEVETLRVRLQRATDEARGKYYIIYTYHNKE